MKLSLKQKSALYDKIMGILVTLGETYWGRVISQREGVMDTVTPNYFERQWQHQYHAARTEFHLTDDSEAIIQLAENLIDTKVERYHSNTRTAEIIQAKVELDTLRQIYQKKAPHFLQELIEERTDALQQEIKSLERKIDELLISGTRQKKQISLMADTLPNINEGIDLLAKEISTHLIPLENKIEQLERKLIEKDKTSSLEKRLSNIESNQAQMIKTLAELQTSITRNKMGFFQSGDTVRKKEASMIPIHSAKKSFV